jgi:hypothetical protein
VIAYVCRSAWIKSAPAHHCIKLIYLEADWGRQGSDNTLSRFCRGLKLFYVFYHFTASACTHKKHFRTWTQMDSSDQASAMICDCRVIGYSNVSNNSLCRWYGTRFCVTNLAAEKIWLPSMNEVDKFKNRVCGLNRVGLFDNFSCLSMKGFSIKGTRVFKRKKIR